MQIQPLLIIPFGLILLSAGVASKTGGWRRMALPAALVVAAGANGIWNFGNLAIYRGDDSRALAAIGEVDRLFPKARTAIVAQGFETWVAWQYVLLRPGDYMFFTEKTVLLPRGSGGGLGSFVPVGIGGAARPASDGPGSSRRTRDCPDSPQQAGTRGVPGADL